MAQRARAATNLTVDEFVVFPTPDGKAEFVRGELRVTPPPGPRHGIVCANLTSLLASHIPLVWVIDPKRRTVMVIARDAPVRWLREGDTLDAGGIVPGFACSIADVFAGID